ncbi:MAG: thioredoxin domain-containing protein [Gammaproteobacteria bacterium]
MNRLKSATSPYLQQHADNPVDWHPWDAEALALAKKENKPILLSIGYSACHWCHVMAHESFENRSIAKLMNKYFVNIKVDREERPDLDRIYQVAHQMLTRQGGGWPLTMFLDPQDHLPIYGGTYFPPQARQGKPGFGDVLKGIGESYGSEKEKMKDFKAQLETALGQALGGGDPAEPDPQMFERACGQIDASFDAKRGGFSEAPKFPHTPGLELLEDAAASDEPAKAERAAEMLDLTLAAMASGGIYDQLGGGFFRYSVDGDWTIPHFEKMLYDNGPLLSLYARRAAATGSPRFREVASETADWMLREMQLEAGGLCSSLDADSEGEEGRFYVWERDEVSELLGESYERFAAQYGLADKANFEKRWHLRLPPPAAAIEAMQATPGADFATERARLLEARDGRTRPGRDDKVLTSWNALAIRGLADAGAALGRDDLLDAAARAVDYLRETHWQEGRLLATSRDGKAQLKAYLDDHVFLVDALLVLLSARWRTADLEFAIALADTLLAHFECAERGAFFFTADDHEKLIQRTRAFGDDAAPSGNGTAARVLLELGHLTGETRFIGAGERTLRAGMSDAGRWPSAHSSLMRALNDFTDPPARLVIRASDPEAATAWRDLAAARLDERARSYVIPAEAGELPGILAERRLAEGAALTAYLCRGATCSAPATTDAAFEQALA